MAGTNEEMEAFAEKLSRQFKTRKMISSAHMTFNGCTITPQRDGSILLDMSTYLSRIMPVPIDKSRKANREERATNTEV